ncbi:HAMP domain-containing sensor histidine kinase [Arcicella sp. LKC2W]|uniref:sensor histidine kinase n=1 Tax=Arcicella sp. LKC2W TaxID=2984198 RepID=UPI002B1FA6AB|nr:HAMP domain-containing sensor histidine kinase [Arcicella sp. LKC2W]MEA5461906.1 HAMP domain-containing sensor histidine kinase [Arcicella sp. LKC2W]
MTLQEKQTLSFGSVVSTILFVALISIYFYTDYFIQKNFYRRLNNRAETVVSWLSQTIEDKEDLDVLKRLLSNRKDLMPYEEIQIFNLQYRKIFSFNKVTPIRIDTKILNEIKLFRNYKFTVDEFDAVGILHETATQRYMVIALAKNDNGDSFLKQLRWNIFALSILSFILIFVIGWFYTRKTLKPIIRIGKELNLVFPQNLERRLTTFQENDEIGNLCKIINQLLERVEDGIKLQQTFISNVSHELQNPLTRISSQLEVSLFKQRNQDEYQKTIASVLEDVVDLIELTQNLLKLSRSNFDSKALLVDSIRLDDMLWETRRILLNNNPKYQINIEFNSLPEESEYLCINGNHALLQTAILNLAENACKFSSNHKVTLTLIAGIESKTITILDEGVGISDDELKSIFQPFYRSDKSTVIKGYGIGLSLVDRIIKVHQGRITINSEVNKGTMFSISFPNQP